ncbi:hypothetical protein ROZALSC1DRAFT_25309, partial [Rozella allomycis CSF55]
MTTTTRSRGSGANSQQEPNENVTKLKILKKLKTENKLKTEKKPKSKNKQKNKWEKETKNKKAPKTGKRIETEGNSKTKATQDVGREKVKIENSMMDTPTERKAYDSKAEQIMEQIRELTEEEYGYISTLIATEKRSQDDIKNKFSDILEFSTIPKENSALREYRQRALLCSKDEKVIEMESILEGKTPFVFMNASSGHGKTQMAFNLQAKGLQVLYIVCSNGGENSQNIYKAFADRQGVFENCLKADMNTISYFDVESIKRDLKKGFVYGFIGALLLNKDKVERKLKRSELLEILKKKKRKPVVFLDEFPQYVSSRNNEEGNQNYLRFMRNVFISMDVKVIISSTCSSSMNMISCGSHSRSEQCDLWCTVFPRLPKYHGAHPTVNSFSAFISNSRPLFAHLAVEYINSNPSASLDHLCAHLLTEIKWKKGKQPQFYDGQVLLFLSASFVEDDSPLINGHFADLVNNENFDIYLKDSFLCTKHDSVFRSWKRVSSFRPFKQDVLMYLSLMGGNGNCPFVHEGTVPFIDALQKALMNDNRAISFKNSNQRANDGMELEASLVGAVCVASHIQGLRGTTVSVFLKDLLYQLKGIH